jgi:hypothetical protein
MVFGQEYTDRMCCSKDEGLGALFFTVNHPESVKIKTKAGIHADTFDKIP